MKFWFSRKALVAGASLLATLGAVQAHATDQHSKHFQLVPNPKFVRCLARFPDDPSRPPTADVFVTRGKLNDTMRLQLKNIQPGLGFDLFTVQNSTFKADGTPNGSSSRGLAWYQSDIEVGSGGTASVEIQTILFDQIFGFDPDVSLAPTNTFHVGFWFDTPDDVVNCLAPGDSNPPTPFNGEHNAGPLAMISLPDADSGLGPLCTNPDFSTNPVSCHP